MPDFSLQEEFQYRNSLLLQMRSELQLLLTANASFKALLLIE